MAEARVDVATMAWFSQTFRDQVVDDVALCMYRLLNVVLFVSSIALLSLAVFFGYEERTLTVLEIMPMMTGFTLLVLSCASILVNADSSRAVLSVYIFVLRALMALSVLTSLIFILFKRRIAESANPQVQEIPHVEKQVRIVALFFLILGVVLGLNLLVTIRVYGIRSRRDFDYEPSKPLGGSSRRDMEYGALEGVYGDGDRDSNLDNSLNTGNNIYGEEEGEDDDEHAIRDKYAALYQKYNL